MLRQDSERKNQAIKQAEKEKRALHKQLADIQARYEQASAGLVQLTQQHAGLKGQESSEKTRLKAQKEKLENLCRMLRAENTKLKESGTRHAVPEQASEKEQPDAVGVTAPAGSKQTADALKQDLQPEAVSSDLSADKANDQ